MQHFSGPRSASMRESMMRWCKRPEWFRIFCIWIWVKLIRLPPSPNNIEKNCLLCTDLVLIGCWRLCQQWIFAGLSEACKKDVHEEMKFRTTRFNLTCIAFLHVTLQTLLKRKLEDSSFLIFCWSVSIPDFVPILFYSMYIFWFWKKRVQQSLILLWGLDPWPLDPLGYPKCFKSFLFNKEKEKNKEK